MDAPNVAAVARSSDHRLRLYTGLALWLASLVFFLTLTPSYPQSWDWSATLVAVLGLDPFRPLSHPLWQFLVSALNPLAGPRLVGAVNVVSALLGSCSIWLVFQIVSRLRYQRSEMRARKGPVAQPRLGVTAGVVAALYAVATVPMLVISTRSHPLSLSALLLLLALFLMVLFREDGKLSRWYVFALVFGLGSVEFATFLLVAPLMLAGWLWMLWTARKLNRGVLLKALPLMAVGVVVGLIFCWRYFQQPVAEWRQFASPFTVMHYFVTDQLWQVLHSVPRLGWLVVFLFMVVPAAQLLGRGFEVAEDLFTRIGLYAFRAMMAVLAVVPLLNLASSPWKLAGLSAPLVTPYLITALWVGYMAGNWLAALSGDFSTGPLNKPAPWRRKAGTGVYAALIALLLVVGWRNARLVDPRHSQSAVDFAQSIVDSLDGRTYLLTDGVLDPLIQLTARASGKEVHLMNRRFGRSPSYMRYVSTWFRDGERQSMARVGLQPLIDTWFAGDRQVTGSVAVLEYPDAWAVRGFTAVPHRAVYLGVATNTTLDALAIYADNMAFLETELARLPGTNVTPSLAGSYRGWMALHLSRMANNLGVLMEDADHPSEAWQAYERALNFEPDNLSTLLNQLSMAESTQRPGSKALRDHIEALTAARKAQLAGWALSVNFGYVRNPQIYLQEGWAWALSGRPEQGVQRMQKALSMVEDTRGVRLAMANMLATEQNRGQGIEIFRSLLNDDPTNQSALMGLARNELAAGRTEEAADLLDRLASTGVKPEEMALERGVLLMMEGKSDEARRAFERIIRFDDQRAPAWLGLLLVAQDRKDAKLFNRAIERLRTFNTFVPGQMILHDLALSRRDAEAARRHIELARRQAPTSTAVLEKLAQLDFAQKQMSEVAVVVGDLLTLDPLNQTGNYLMAIQHYREGRLDLAEAAFRRTLIRGAWGPVLNDLAWVLYEQGKLEDAADTARKAVEREPEQPLFWGTLGMIHYKQGDLAKAAELHEKAVSLAQGRTPIAEIHLAMIYQSMGRKDAARRVLDGLRGREDQLSPDERAEFEKMSKTLTDSIE